MRDIEFTLNGEPARVAVEDHWTLLRALREGLGLMGTKEGCGNGECGACTVILDGRPVNSCVVLALEVEARSVRTIEGEADGENLSDLQQAFIDEGAIQCGYCTPGMIMSARALLMRNPDPGEEEAREAICGNLCRCTGYKPIISAILEAARREKKHAG